MPFYLCSLTNTKKAGRIPELITDSAEEIAAFVTRWDVPGRAVYSCPNPLKAGATRRSIENVDRIEKIIVDLDFKDIVETAEEIDTKLCALPLEPTCVRDSGGGGRHIEWTLKEPVPASDHAYFARACAALKHLVTVLNADPAPSHPAALFRVEGSHNSKREGEPKLCRALWGSSRPVDLSEIEALIGLLPDTGIFTPKEHPCGNSPEGDGKNPYERLATMELHGVGVAGIHAAQTRAISSLLSRGIALTEVIRVVLEATKERVAHEPEAENWDWREEELTIAYSGAAWINQHPELCDRLPDKLREQWQQYEAEGRTPFIKKNAYALYVTTHEQKGPKKGHAPKPLALHPFRPLDEASFPPRAFEYGKHYQRRTTSLTAGAGGMGKSSLNLVEGVAQGAARNLLGEQPAERLRVWYHNGEDPREEIERRLIAICKHHGVPHSELVGRLWVTSGNEVPLRVAKGYSNLEIDENLVRQISEMISTNEIDVAMFDPLVTLHSVPEIDTGKMDAVIRLFARIAEENNTCIDLAHHVRKPAAGMCGDYEIDDIRGVKAITDAVRAVRLLNRMSPKDAEDAGLSEEERLRRFRIDHAKGNYSPAQKATWCQFVNVELLNGDEVGVVAAWEFPGQGKETPEKKAAERKAEQVFLQLLDKYTARGTNVSSNFSPNYAPAKFAEEREAKAAKVSKAMLRQAMASLLDAGKIVSEPLGRSDRPGHRLVRAEGPQ
jgi:RecA-family ATPase